MDKYDNKRTEELNIPSLLVLSGEGSAKQYVAVSKKTKPDDHKCIVEVPFISQEKETLFSSYNDIIHNPYHTGYYRLIELCYKYYRFKCNSCRSRKRLTIHRDFADVKGKSTYRFEEYIAQLCICMPSCAQVSEKIHGAVSPDGVNKIFKRWLSTNDEAFLEKLILTKRICIHETVFRKKPVYIIASPIQSENSNGTILWMVDSYQSLLSFFRSLAVQEYNPDVIWVDCRDNRAVIDSMKQIFPQTYVLISYTMLPKYMDYCIKKAKENPTITKEELVSAGKTKSELLRLLDRNAYDFREGVEDIVENNMAFNNVYLPLCLVIPEIEASLHTINPSSRYWNEINAFDITVEQSQVRDFDVIRARIMYTFNGYFPKALSSPAEMMVEFMTCLDLDDEIEFVPEYCSGKRFNPLQYCIMSSKHSGHYGIPVETAKHNLLRSNGVAVRYLYWTEHPELIKLVFLIEFLKEKELVTPKHECQSAQIELPRFSIDYSKHINNIIDEEAAYKSGYIEGLRQGELLGEEKGIEDGEADAYRNAIAIAYNEIIEILRQDFFDSITNVLETHNCSQGQSYKNAKFGSDNNCRKKADIYEEDSTEKIAKIYDLLEEYFYKLFVEWYKTQDYSFLYLDFTGPDGRLAEDSIVHKIDNLNIYYSILSVLGEDFYKKVISKLMDDDERIYQLVLQKRGSMQ